MVLCADMSKCYKDTSKFKKWGDDQSYSNEPKRYQSVVHAIAKATHFWILNQIKINISTQRIVEMMQAERPHLVKNGSWPTNWHKVEGTLFDEQGTKFKLQINVGDNGHYWAQGEQCIG